MEAVSAADAVDEDEARVCRADVITVHNHVGFSVVVE